MAFRIDGPHRLKLDCFSDTASGIKVSYVEKKGSLEILRELPVHSRAGGIYVFVIRRRGAGNPWYVGKNEGRDQGSLYKEALTIDKLRKYARALAAEESGTALLYFLSPADRRTDSIDDLEEFLIWLARQKNPRLLNKKKVRLSPESLYEHMRRHQISGLLNGNRGNPGAAATFRNMIGWNRAMHVVGM